MAWKEVSIMNERCSFVLMSERCEKPFSSLCMEYGISRKTGYKWVERYNKYGLKSLKELSRRPLSCPHKTAKEIEVLILSERHKHKTWGAKKIRQLLIDSHQIEHPPAISTIGDVLKRNGVSMRKRRNRRIGYTLPLQHLTIPDVANDVWTVDFKGWFKTQDEQRCDPLTVMDLHSRYLLCAKILKAQTTRATKPAFIALFKRYGIPKVIRGG